MFLSIGMLKLNYFLADIFILSAEKQPIKLSWRKIEWLQLGKPISLDTIAKYYKQILEEENINNHFCLYLLKGDSIIQNKGNAHYSFLTLSKILCKWKQDSVVSLFLYLNSVFKHKHKLIHNQVTILFSALT